MSFYAVHDGIRYFVHTEVGNGLTRVVIEPDGEPEEDRSDECCDEDFA